MKKLLFSCLLAACLALPATTLAAGDDIDMAKVSCEEFLNSGSNMTMMLTWIDGYMSGISDNTVISNAWMEKLGAHMGQYCSKNSGKTIMDAIKAMPAE